MNKNLLNESKFLNPSKSYTVKYRKKDCSVYIDSTWGVYRMIWATVWPIGIRGSNLFRNKDFKIINKTEYELKFAHWFFGNFTYAKLLFYSHIFLIL